ncbi:MAG: hypothetical protein SCARUB_03247 [Candidatus Scalindua rubra]|uniref:Uncharacterized protein n=1 Tax=Candidatus Scalindua rubra TaxID=1872076 RepID=A0A1E3X7M2_9BACT|nr:MAG: hypothetical protein SCARUB_03247 [Candidatus Scalindua rubra]
MKRGKVMNKQIVKNDVLEKVRREAIKAVPIPKSLKKSYKITKENDRIVLETKKK